MIKNGLTCKMFPQFKSSKPKQITQFDFQQNIFRKTEEKSRLFAQTNAAEIFYPSAIAMLNDESNWPKSARDCCPAIKGNVVGGAGGGGQFSTESERGKYAPQNRDIYHQTATVET